MWTYPVRVPSAPGSRNMQHVSVYSVVVPTCPLCSGFPALCGDTCCYFCQLLLNGLRCDSRLGRDLAGVKLEMGDVKLVSSQSPFIASVLFPIECLKTSHTFAVFSEQCSVCGICVAFIYIQGRTGMVVTVLRLLLQH